MPAPTYRRAESDLERWDRFDAERAARVANRASSTVRASAELRYLANRAGVALISWQPPTNRVMHANVRLPR